MPAVTVGPMRSGTTFKLHTYLGEKRKEGSGKTVGRVAFQSKGKLE